MADVKLERNTNVQSQPSICFSLLQKETRGRLKAEEFWLVSRIHCPLVFIFILDLYWNLYVYIYIHIYKTESSRGKQKTTGNKPFPLQILGGKRIPGCELCHITFGWGLQGIADSIKFDWLRISLWHEWHKMNLCFKFFVVRWKRPVENETGRSMCVQLVGKMEWLRWGKAG